MSEKQKKKPDENSPLRDPKPKTNKFGLGIKLNELRFPHDELIKPLDDEIKEAISPPTTTPLHLLPPPTRETSEAEKVQQEYPISPAKDFQKVPNSVVRDALPQGLFKGTSKHTYDALFYRTRGAVVPVRTIKVRFNDLMNWTSISHNTLRNHLRHLEQVGLIKRDWQLGDNHGAVYEVFVPEELAPLPPPTTSYHQLQPGPTSRQNLVSPSYQKLVGGGGGQIVKNKDTSVVAKTILKTSSEGNDDEPAAPFGAFNEKFNEIVKELNGKGITISDEAKLGQIAELLAAELREAAARTKIVTDPVAFLLTHLRRRLGVRAVTVETASEKKTEKPSKHEIRLTADEVQECPDCQGRLVIYPQGREKGAIMCKHPELIKSKQETAKESGKEEPKEGKQQRVHIDKERH